MDDKNRLINDCEAAKRVGFAVQTLRNYRFQHRGPRYVKLGRAVRYRVSDLQEWVARHVVDPEGV